MIDYQPSHGMRHCICSNVADGFTYSSTAETYVHAACGKPRPTVQTNLHQLPAPVEAEVRGAGSSAVSNPQLTVTGAPLVSVVTASDREDVADIGVTPEQRAPIEIIGPMEVDDETARRLAPEPPAEQPKRRRGRPPKDTRGLALERRDAPDRWCVIREATGEIIASGLTSKAKATAAMDDLIRKASDDDSEPAGAPDLATTGALPDPAQPAPTGGPQADHDPAEAGQPAGPAAGGVRAAVAGGQPEDQAARGAENVDQGGAEPTVPGAGGHGDQPEPEAAAEVLPAGQGAGGPGEAPEDVPGGVGPVHEGRNDLETRQIVTQLVAQPDNPDDPSDRYYACHNCGTLLSDCSATDALCCPGCSHPQKLVPVIHGPQGDCPECFRLWAWCPDSGVPNNPPAPEASPTTSGPGGLPASAVQPGPTACDACGALGRVCDSCQPSTTPSTLVDNPEANARHSTPWISDPSAETTYSGTVFTPDGQDVATFTAAPVDNPGDNLSPTITSAQVSTQPGTTLTLPGAVIDSSRPSLAAFMSAAKHVAQSGNTPWAAQYANELRQIVIDDAANDPRSLQRHLGPSEIGVECDRQVVGKLVGFEKTNHVADPWPSIMGRAGHKAMEDTFRRHNDIMGWQRWLVEHRVTGHADHEGTSDLYDALNFCVDDHKFLGEGPMAKLRADNVPPKYFFQLLTYRRGYQLMGYRVDRIVIIGWPRTGSSVDGMYVWEHVCTPEDDVKLDTLFARMEWRKQWATAISAGNARLSDVPAVPDAEECYFCNFYRPQSARDGGPGCPGHAGL